MRGTSAPADEQMLDNQVRSSMAVRWLQPRGYHRLGGGVASTTAVKQYQDATLGTCPDATRQARLGGIIRLAVTAWNPGNDVIVHTSCWDRISRGRSFSRPGLEVNTHGWILKPAPGSQLNIKRRINGISLRGP